MIWLVIALFLSVGVPAYVVVDELRTIRRALQSANAISLGYRPSRDELPDVVTIHLPAKEGGQG